MMLLTIRNRLHKLIWDLTWPLKKRIAQRKMYKVFRTRYFASWDMVKVFDYFYFDLFKEFYEHGGIDTVVWNATNEHKEAKKSMDKIYHWYKYTLPGKQEAHNIRLSIYYKKYPISVSNPDYSRVVFTRSQTSYEEFADIAQMNDTIEREKDEMLKLLIGIRSFLWT